MGRIKELLTPAVSYRVVRCGERVSGLVEYGGDLYVYRLSL